MYDHINMNKTQRDVTVLQEDKTLTKARYSQLDVTKHTHTHNGVLGCYHSEPFGRL
jgi:hypothetical protein